MPQVETAELKPLIRIENYCRPVGNHHQIDCALGNCSHIAVVVLDSDPKCDTNISLPGNAVDLSDHVEISCSVTFNGTWTPVFACAPDLPGITTVDLSELEQPELSRNDTNQTSPVTFRPSHVTYKHVIAASDIEDFAVLNCSMTFDLATDYQDMSPDIHITPENPVYKFVWNTSVIRVVNSSGMYVLNTY